MTETKQSNFTGNIPAAPLIDISEGVKHNSDWVYFTSIRPRRKGLEGEDGNNEYNKELNSAFNIFINECKLTKEKITEYLNENDKYSMIIKTDNKNDEVNKKSNYHVKFLRSVFLTNPKFKRELINYYNPIGYYINGPQQISKDEWNIELSHKIGY